MKRIILTFCATTLLAACSAENPESSSQNANDNNPRPICGGLVACLPPQTHPLPEHFKQHAVDTLQLQSMNLGALTAFESGNEPDDASAAALVRLLKNARCAKESVREADGTVVKKIGSPNCPVGSELTSRVATKDSTTRENASTLLRVFHDSYAAKGKLRYFTSETQSVANLEDVAPGQFRVDLNGGDSGSLETEQGEKLEFQGGWSAQATVGAPNVMQPQVVAYKGTMESRLRFTAFEAQLQIRFERSQNGRVLAEAFLNGERVQLTRSSVMSQLVARVHADAIRAVQNRGL